MAVTNQPGRFAPSEFQTGLFDCFKDCKTCCNACWCYFCIGCSITKDMDESCLWGNGIVIRAVYRTRYNIRGSLCEDVMRTSCCQCCATWQLRRDIDLRKERGQM